MALSLVALLYKAASSATPAVRMVLGRSARILGGCGAVGDIARAYFLAGVLIIQIYIYIHIHVIPILFLLLLLYVQWAAAGDMVMVDSVNTRFCWRFSCNYDLNLTALTVTLAACEELTDVYV